MESVSSDLVNFASRQEKSPKTVLNERRALYPMCSLCEKDVLYGGCNAGIGWQERITRACEVKVCDNAVSGEQKVLAIINGQWQFVD